jgi:ribosomal protein S18 acetylase RimI-like enzyme
MSLIREYKVEDAEQVEECFVELQDFLRLIDSKIADGRKVAKKYIERMFRRCAETNGKVFVAETDSRVVGMVCVYAKVNSDEIDEEEYEYAYISDLVILAAYRRRGLGRALLQRAEDYASLQGAALLKINVLARNDTARKLYTNYGFQEYEVSLFKNLRVDKNTT